MASNSTDETGRVDIGSQASFLHTLRTAADALGIVAAQFHGPSALSESFERAVELIVHCKGRLIVAGVGKSGHIGRKIAATMASTGTPSFFVHPTEASHGDLGMISPGDVVLLLSWSGETSELGNVLGYAARFGIATVAITSAAGSTLGRNSDIVLCLPRIEEACPHGLAPTTSTLLQLLVGDALAVALLQRRGFTQQDFKVFHPGGKLGAQLAKVGEIGHGEDKMPVVPLGTLMGEAILVTSAKGFGVVGITDDNGYLCGIITDGDLRRHMSPSLLAQPVESVMASNPRVVSADELAAVVMRILESLRITALFIIDDDGRPRGIVHIHDLLRAGVV